VLILTPAHRVRWAGRRGSRFRGDHVRDVQRACPAPVSRVTVLPSDASVLSRGCDKVTRRANQLIASIARRKNIFVAARAQGDAEPQGCNCTPGNPWIPGSLRAPE
jgi:hypothetical protein